jgi:hypothetical protein
MPGTPVAQAESDAVAGAAASARGAAAPLLPEPAVACPRPSTMSGIMVSLENALPGDRLVFSEGYAVAGSELTFNGVGTGILAGCPTPCPARSRSP